MSLTQTAIFSRDIGYASRAPLLQRAPFSSDRLPAYRCSPSHPSYDNFVAHPASDASNHSYISISANSDSEDSKKYETGAKYKTEMCNNFQLTGKCKFGQRCCFAHGFHELREKTQLGKSYKLKVCKNYHDLGYCKYGQRCQYVHLKEGELFGDILQTIQNKIAKSLRERSDERLDTILSQSERLQKKLPVFQSILKKAQQAQ